MKLVPALAFLSSVLSCGTLFAQQVARSGVDLRTTLTAQTVISSELTEKPRSGWPIIAGSRAVFYPTIKFNENWFVTGALQLLTRPNYYADFGTSGYGAKGMVLQGSLNYSRTSDRGSMVARAGEMSSAFGSYLLRYDDAENALTDLPPGYGYYYVPVSFLALTGVELDGARARFDGRVQFSNSSPTNPRNPFARDQYGNWAGGGGYTIRQGLRVGVSGYRGPYLDRHYAFYFHGEQKPVKLPAHAVGVDANWAHGHTSAYAEADKFLMPYTKIPNFRESTTYGELKQVLNPRWFAAGRNSYLCNSATGGAHTVEVAAGYRPNRWQLLKFAFEEEHHRSGASPNDHTFGFQFITVLDRSFSRN